MNLSTQRDLFQDIRVPDSNGCLGRGYRHGRVPATMKWKCRRCGQIIARNAACAESHIAKHLRGLEPCACTDFETCIFCRRFGAPGHRR